MNSVEWNPKYNLLAYAGDDKNKYQNDEGSLCNLARNKYYILKEFLMQILLLQVSFEYLALKVPLKNV